MEQIWKDKVFSAATDTLPIEISVDGETIYKGTLSSFPGSTEVKTQLNRLCESFLSIEYPEASGVTAHPEALRTFIVSDNSGNTLTSVDFIYDWSYEDFRPVLSNPVNGHLDSRMRVPYTLWSGDNGDITIHTE